MKFVFLNPETHKCYLICQRAFSDVVKSVHLKIRLLWLAPKQKYTVDGSGNAPSLALKRSSQGVAILPPPRKESSFSNIWILALGDLYGNCGLQNHMIR